MTIDSDSDRFRQISRGRRHMFPRRFAKFEFRNGATVHPTNAAHKELQATQRPGSHPPSAHHPENRNYFRGLTRPPRNPLDRTPGCSPFVPWDPPTTESSLRRPLLWDTRRFRPPSQTARFPARRRRPANRFSVLQSCCSPSHLARSSLADFPPPFRRPEHSFIVLVCQRRGKVNDHRDLHFHCVKLYFKNIPS